MATESVVELEDIEKRARVAFAFLDSVSVAPVESFRTAAGSRISFLKAELFVDVELDWQELAAFVLVGLPVDGRRPSGYYMDKQGRHVRWHLVAPLAAGGYHDEVRTLKSLTKKSGPDAMLDQINAYATEVQARLNELPDLIRKLQHP